jgi:tetratricopeptide (TPR) repeat protein
MQLDRLNDAKDMYLWPLRGCEGSYGLQDPNTFWGAMALADFYMAKGELDQAEKEFHQALKGFDATINSDHFFSRFTAARLGMICQQQGNYALATAMYQRVHERCLRLLGPDHW